jgi:phage shock protein A
MTITNQNAGEISIMEKLINYHNQRATEIQKTLDDFQALRANARSEVARHRREVAALVKKIEALKGNATS